MHPTTYGATPGAAAPDTQTLTATKAAFALRGHLLQRSIRVGDGRVTYSVSKWGQSRSFTHWNDVQAFLNQIGGAV